MILSMSSSVVATNNNNNNKKNATAWNFLIGFLRFSLIGVALQWRYDIPSSTYFSSLSSSLSLSQPPWWSPFQALLTGTCSHNHHALDQIQDLMVLERTSSSASSHRLSSVGSSIGHKDEDDEWEFRSAQHWNHDNNSDHIPYYYHPDDWRIVSSEEFDLPWILRLCLLPVGNWVQSLSSSSPSSSSFSLGWFLFHIVWLVFLQWVDYRIAVQFQALTISAFATTTKTTTTTTAGKDGSDDDTSNQQQPKSTTTQQPAQATKRTNYPEYLELDFFYWNQKYANAVMAASAKAAKKNNRNNNNPNHHPDPTPSTHSTTNEDSSPPMVQVPRRCPKTDPILLFFLQPPPSSSRFDQQEEKEVTTTTSTPSTDEDNDKEKEEVETVVFRLPQFLYFLYWGNPVSILASTVGGSHHNLLVLCLVSALGPVAASAAANTNTTDNHRTLSPHFPYRSIFVSAVWFALGMHVGYSGNNIAASSSSPSWLGATSIPMLPFLLPILAWLCLSVPSSSSPSRSPVLTRWFRVFGYVACTMAIYSVMFLGIRLVVVGQTNEEEEKDDDPTKAWSFWWFPFVVGNHQHQQQQYYQTNPTVQPSLSIFWYTQMESFDRFSHVFPTLLGLWLPHLIVLPAAFRLPPFAMTCLYWLVIRALLSLNSSLYEWTVGICFLCLAQIESPFLLLWFPPQQQQPSLSLDKVANTTSTTTTTTLEKPSNPNQDEDSAVQQAATTNYVSSSSPPRSTSNDDNDISKHQHQVAPPSSSSSPAFSIPWTWTWSWLIALFVVCAMAVVPLPLFVLLHALWLQIGNGEANFLFFQCLAWNILGTIGVLLFVQGTVQWSKLRQLCYKQQQQKEKGETTSQKQSPKTTSKEYEPEKLASVH